MTRDTDENTLSESPSWFMKQTYLTLQILLDCKMNSSLYPPLFNHCKPVRWICFWPFVPPMVGSWNSKNSSRTKRTTKHDFPTAVSPKRTSLKWWIRLLFPVDMMLLFYNDIYCAVFVDKQCRVLLFLLAWLSETASCCCCFFDSYPRSVNSEKNRKLNNHVVERGGGWDPTKRALCRRC